MVSVDIIKSDSRGFVKLCSGALYMHITNIFKHIFQNRLPNESKIKCGASFVQVNDYFVEL